MEPEIQTHPQMVSVIYSSIIRRFIALILDAIILGIIAVLASFVVPFLGGIIVWFFYAPILEASELRATLGKHLMGIQVADLMGRRISLSAAFIRNLMKIVSGAFVFFGFIMAFFTSRKQTLHDLLADTIVVYGRSEAPVIGAWIETTKNGFRVGKIKVASYVASTSGDSVVEQLERVNVLHTQGSLTAAEFEAAKKKILE